MIEEMAISLIKDVGVPAAAFVMMYALYVSTQRWQQKQQEKTEARIDKIFDCFIKTVKEIIEKNNETVNKHTEALEKNTKKLEEHIRSKEEFIDLIKEERRTQAHG